MVAERDRACFPEPGSVVALPDKAQSLEEWLFAKSDEHMNILTAIATLGKSYEHIGISNISDPNKFSF